MSLDEGYSLCFLCHPDRNIQGTIWSARTAMERGGFGAHSTDEQEGILFVTDKNARNPQFYSGDEAKKYATK